MKTKVLDWLARLPIILMVVALLGVVLLGAITMWGIIGTLIVVLCGAWFSWGVTYLEKKRWAKK